MKASELLRAQVYDRNGRKVGRVYELEAEKSGPVVNDIQGNAWQVARLIVGPASAILRLGFQRKHLKGPLGLKWIAERLDGYEVDWDKIEDISETKIVLSCTADELRPLDSGSK